MTRKDLCQLIVNQHFRRRPINESEILKSSKLAVAMEYLNLIKEPYLKEYAQSRGGIVFSGNVSKNDCEFKTLSLRDILALLPE